MSAIIGQGWAFPIRVNARGALGWASGDDLIAQAIWIVLSTPRRSRLMQPDFGCAIHDWLFAPDNAQTRAQIEAEVTRALTRWEPRVDVLSVRAQSGAEPGLLLIDIATRLRGNNAALNLVYPFYLTEGIAR